MVEANRLFIAFYGDDFTGSTDALEFLSRAGIKTVLFIAPPTKEQLRRYHGLEAIGVAGMTRAMAPADMKAELKPAFESLRKLNPRHVHYKVCSTFDSSPNIGNIGTAIEAGTEVFGMNPVPLLVAAPALGRHCAFGNLFARMGIGSEGAIYRLDRHPSMNKHPTTPADESDLRLHLGKQTNKKIGLIDILEIEKPVSAMIETYNQLKVEGSEIFLIDALYQHQMQKIGELIDSQSSDSSTLFSVGSSGIEMALSSYRQGNEQPVNLDDFITSASTLVLSGSCSPITEAQISFALNAGFEEIAIDTVQLAENGLSEELLQAYAQEACRFISEGKNLIIHTSKGYSDERVTASEAVFLKRGISKTQISVLYGTALGIIATKVVDQADVKRIVIAGGDTSSHAARAMKIEAVEMIAPLSPGAPLCKAFAPGSAVDSREINFKGGQVGKEDYFLVAAGLTKL